MLMLLACNCLLITIRSRMLMKRLTVKNYEILMETVCHHAKQSCYNNFCEQIISSIWNNAHQKIPTTYNPENNGWIQSNNHQYHLKWFEGDQLPNFVSDALQTLSETNEEDDDDEQKISWCGSGDEYEENYINDENY